MPKREITPADVLPMEEYAKVRAERRRRVAGIKRDRRLAVGPDATVHFECYETMLHQVHEMLYVERGGAKQLPGELAAYNPLIPNGRELVATLMFEIEDPVRRDRFLSALGGVERTLSIAFARETVAGRPEVDVERTTAAGKASSVHFLHFPFTEAEIAAFRRPGTEAVLKIAHPRYGHAAVIPENVRAALAKDFD
jgi:hypothetical protein